MRKCNCGENVVYARRDRHVFVVCGGENCRCAGARDLLDYLNGTPKLDGVDVQITTSKDCIGHCAAAPAMVEDGEILRWVSPRRLRGELLRLGITS